MVIGMWTLFSPFGGSLFLFFYELKRLFSDEEQNQGSFPEQQFIEPNVQANSTNYPSFVKSENVTKASTLTITVEPKVPIIEGALDQLNKWQFPISFLSGIITGHLGPWIFNKIRSKNKYKK